MVQMNKKSVVVVVVVILGEQDKVGMYQAIKRIESFNPQQQENTMAKIGDIMEYIEYHRQCGDW